MFEFGQPPLFNRPGARTAIAVYIFVVATIFFVLLRQLYHPLGLGWYVNILLHYLNPPLYLLDWALFVPKQSLRFAAIPVWLIYPLTYALYTLAHGAAAGWYPYPFMDAGTYGYPKTLLNIAALTIFFVVLFAAFITIGLTFPLCKLITIPSANYSRNKD